MLKWIITFVLMVIVLGLALDAFACVINTIVVDGRIINCTTCGNVTNCY